MLTADESRRRARNLLSVAVTAREAGDEEAADQLVLLASELFKQAAQHQSWPAAHIADAPPTAPGRTLRLVGPTR